MLKKVFMARIGVLLALVFFPILSVSHADGEMNIPRGKWWHLPEITQNLNLTDGERDQLDRLFTQSRLKMIDLAGSIQKKKFQLEQALDDKQFNEEMGMDLFRELQGAQAELAMNRFMFVMEVRKLLGYDRYQALLMQYREFRKKRVQNKKNTLLERTLDNLKDKRQDKKVSPEEVFPPR